MRIIVGVDWSDPGPLVVEAILRFYAPQELILVHAVNLGALESHALVPALAEQAHEDLRRAKQLARDAACQPLDRIAAQTASDVPAVRQVCEVGSPAALILDTAQSATADLVAVGHRGLGQISELVMGSVSHRVLLNATCSTLIIKGAPKTPRRVLAAVQGSEDMERIQSWLLTHPFKFVVDLRVMSVVPHASASKLTGALSLKSWNEAALKAAHDLVNSMAFKLNGSHYTARGHVSTGDPVKVIAKEANRFDLLIVGSHGRTGLHRFLLGSVSHSLLHRVTSSVLIVR